MDATFWHYTLAFPLLILLGTLVHCLRAWPNFVPDRQDFTPGNPLLERNPIMLHRIRRL